MPCSSMICSAASKSAAAVRSSCSRGLPTVDRITSQRYVTTYRNKKEHAMTNNETNYDVAIVGASIAGCTAAMLFGQAGLRVALLERSQHRESHKAMC